MRTGEGTFFRDRRLREPLPLPALAHGSSSAGPARPSSTPRKPRSRAWKRGSRRPGRANTCEDIANAFFAVLKRHGNREKDNRTGYPIGLSYPPDWGERTMSLRPGDTTVLQPGMTFHFMTGLWLEGHGARDHREHRHHRTPGWSASATSAAQALREELTPCRTTRPPSPIVPTVDHPGRRRPARPPAPALQPRRTRAWGSVMMPDHA